VVNAGLLELLNVGGGQHDDGRITGVVIGIVTNNKDPDRLGRVKVRFPWLSGSTESDWARVATPMAGNGRGLYFLPEVDDEVLVLFERGDVRFPFVIGALWNGKDQAPADNGDGKNTLRVIKSRSGHLIRFDDSEQAQKIEIIDATSNNRVVIDTKTETVTITAKKHIVLEAPQGDIRLAAKQVAIEASGSADLKADSMKIAATGHLVLKGDQIDLN
jgi:uncharacterized protein involved in type VI secretion and phage assembly